MWGDCGAAAKFARRESEPALIPLAIKSLLAPSLRAGRPLSGITVVLTGSLQTMTREQAGAALQALGAKVSSAVSKRTSYLIAGAEAGSKLERAQQLGVPVLDESALARLLRGEIPVREISS